MPKAKKTQSGKWRITVFDYYDSAGKLHQKTFTAETKKEVERLAREYKSAPQTANLTVGEAVRAYIDMKESALSPSSVRGYLSNYRNYFESSRFGAIQVNRLTSIDAQRFVSDLISEGKSPKTIRCIYGLLTASVKMYRPDLVLSVTLPAARKPELHTPSTDEVNQLIAYIRDDRELYIVVLLCAFGPMRRSEACAVRFEDIDYQENAITVRRSVVRDAYKGFIYKDIPKNYSSYRTIQYPSEVIRAIGSGKGYVITTYSPESVTKRLRTALRHAGLPHFRLHDLRHYSASILHAIGIPDQYIMARGGWKTDHVMKRVYRDTISDEEKKMNDRINNYFGGAF